MFWVVIIYIASTAINVTFGSIDFPVWETTGVDSMVEFVLVLLEAFSLVYLTPLQKHFFIPGTSFTDMIELRFQDITILQ